MRKFSVLKDDIILADIMLSDYKNKGEFKLVGLMDPIAKVDNFTHIYEINRDLIYFDNVSNTYKVNSLEKSFTETEIINVIKLMFNERQEYYKKYGKIMIGGPGIIDYLETTGSKVPINILIYTSLLILFCFLYFIKRKQSLNSNGC